MEINKLKTKVKDLERKVNKLNKQVDFIMEKLNNLSDIIIEMGRDIQELREWVKK
jgi:peptidoglycan hydrolase CwlO-like protein